MSDPNQYTVGWICAIPTESIAACLFLDKEHDRAEFVSVHDDTDYTLGEMAGHNVVIAVLPDGEYGLTSAATAAKDLMKSFPNVRIGLMVGIGGGAPSKGHDIRLGDVAVSSGKGGVSAVYQYDYGKLVQGGDIQPTRILDQPPTLVRSAVSGLQTQYKRKGHTIRKRIKDILEENPRLREEFSRPAKDHMYKVDVVHPSGHEGSCEESCGVNSTCLVERRNRNDHEDDPAIHYGVIASANTLMKDANKRDALAKEKGVICFEMEAAGLMNHFPCLVVRGICDYSDSHKNNDWQGYAAMTASAYAYDILSRIAPSKVETERVLSEVLDNIRNVNVGIEKQEYRDCHQAFKSSTYEQFKNDNPDSVEQTCQWALSHPLYQRWRDSNVNDLLWISADPGCGKSVLSKSLVDKELRGGVADSVVCYFFFKDNDEQDNLATGLCALLHQLFGSQPHLLHHAVPAWSKNGNKLQKEVDELWRILLVATSDPYARSTTCVLDALDECKDKDRKDLIAKLSRFHEDAAARPNHQTWLKFIVTSRPYDDIQQGFQQIPSSLPAIRLRGEQESDQIRMEIDRVIELRVAQLKDDFNLWDSTSVRLKKALLEMEHRTYLWLHLAIDDTRRTLRNSLMPNKEEIKTMPRSVEDAYDKILRRVERDQQHKVMVILQIIVGARRPLAVGEMALALDLAISKDCRTFEEAQIETGHLAKYLRDWCGLFVSINHSRIYLIHQTAREFLLARQDARPPRTLTDGSWRQSLRLVEADQTMAKVCISCLNLEDLQYFSSDNRAAAVEAVDTSKTEFIEYCLEWWTIHFRHSESEFGEDDLQGVLRLYEVRKEAFQFRYQPPKRTVIHLAAINGHERILDSLLGTMRGFVNAIDDHGHTALYWASHEGYAKIVQMLLENGADVNVPDESYGNALQAASDQGHEKVVQVLLENGADVNVPDKFYGSALQAASYLCYEKIVQMLLDNGADVNARGKYDSSALREAYLRGHDKIVQMLLENGADSTHVYPRDDVPMSRGFLRGS